MNTKKFLKDFLIKVAIGAIIAVAVLGKSTVLAQEPLTTKNAPACYVDHSWYEYNLEQSDHYGLYQLCREKYPKTPPTIFIGDKECPYQVDSKQDYWILYMGSWSRCGKLVGMSLDDLLFKDSSGELYTITFDPALMTKSREKFK